MERSTINAVDAPTLGRYRIVGHLATGGMAEILLAVLVGKHGFERPVVIKRILPSLARDTDFVAMFIDEARIIADLHHPNVVQVIELEHSDDQLFLVLEYLEGEPVSGLQRRLRASNQTIDPTLAAYVIASACAGLHAAHELKDADGNSRNLVHRDVTPQNLFVNYNGAVKVLDFGIAKASDRITKTEAGQLKGKEGYAAPEHCMGQPVDRRADVFALGIVLYELTTGRRLFKGATLLESLQRIVSGKVVPPSSLVPDYPVELERICLRALAHAATDRFQTAADMRRSLLAFTQSQRPGAALDEDLGTLMHALFPERITQKKEALRSLAHGAASVPIPEAEVDLSVELPAAKSSLSTAFPMPLATLGPPPVSARRRVAAMLLAVGVLLLLAALPAVWVYTSSSTPEAPVARAANAAAPPVQTEPSVQPVPGPAAPEVVRIDIVTVPEGASVRVDGEERGLTPLTLELPRAESSVELEVALEDYESISQPIVADVAQRLRLVLQRRATRGNRRRPTKNRGFRAFD